MQASTQTPQAKPPLVLKTGPVFLKNYRALKRFVINRGGTSSSKTYSVLMQALNWLLTGQLTDSLLLDTGTFSIARKYGANLRTSVQKDFEDILTAYDLWDVVSVSKGDRSYSVGPRRVEMIGVDDPQKARWPRREILYCNEANELSEEDFFQLQIRTKYRVIIDFNPDDEDHWINQKLEIARARDENDVEVIVSTYRDNPFLDPQIVSEIERMQEKDPAYYRIYGLGQYGKLEGVVFSFEDLPDVPEGARLLCRGQDFGYTNDPSACVSLYQWNGDIVLHEEFYRTGMQNSDISAAYENAGFSRTDEIFADSAEPKSIDELVARWWNVKPVKKGPDSIKFGIDCLKAQKIFVTASSTNLRKEMRSYVWAKDKAGNALNVPVWGKDHCFVGDTQIRVPGWFKRISELRPGDVVNTPAWFQRVTRFFDNGIRLVKRYYFSDGTEIVCTPNHRIHTSRGWVEIDAVRYSDIVTLWKLTAIATNAGKNTKHPTTGVQDSVRTVANPLSDAIPVSTTFNGLAKSADDISFAIDIRTHDFAKIIGSEEVGNSRVYDLEIENEHCFYANGVLVHNCIDAARYGAMMKLKVSGFRLVI